MECDACLRMHDVSDQMLCVTCARSNIYLARLELARSLLEKERLGRQIQATIQPFSTGSPLKDDLRHVQQVWEVEKAEAEMAAIKAGISDTKGHMDTLRKENQQLKQKIEARKARILARRGNLEAAMKVVPPRQQNTINDITRINDELEKVFHNTNNRLTKTKAFLCGELATLMRLKQKKISRNGVKKQVYSLAGMVLPDLREINNIRCVDLSATLGNFAHFLVQICFYLGVRLPAEITSPHRDYPLATINTPPNSFLGRKMPFPGSGSTGLGPQSPVSSTIEASASFRPRPLFIGSDDLEEKVAQFAKRDPPAFNLFIEGISLLAWNVAWLNRSQGFSAGTTTWEDICDIGRSIWQLTQTPAQSPALLRVLSTRDARSHARSQDQSDITTPATDTANTLGRLGQASHISAHSYLGSSGHAEQMRTWKLDRWNLISDSLKKHLLTEMTNAEWEILQEQEWDDGGEQFDEAVMIGASKTDTNKRDNDDDKVDQVDELTSSHCELATLHFTSNIQGNDDFKPRRLSGWTKLKNRDKDLKEQDKGKLKEIKAQDKEAKALDKSITKTRDKDEREPRT